MNYFGRFVGMLLFLAWVSSTMCGVQASAAGLAAANAPGVNHSPKMVNTAAEIDFLFENVFKDSDNQYIFPATQEPVIMDFRRVKKITVERGGWWCPDRTIIELDNEGAIRQSLEGKVETQIPASCTSEEDLLSRITSTIKIDASKKSSLTLDGTLQTTSTTIANGTITSHLEGTVTIKEKKYAMIGELVTKVEPQCSHGVLQLKSQISHSFNATSAPLNEVNLVGHAKASGSTSMANQVLSSITGTATLMTSTVEYNNADMITIPLETKMQAVESLLKSRSESSASADLVERIDFAYKKLKHDDWLTDNIRFGISPLYLMRVDAFATSVSMNTYFAYRRYSPVAKFPWDWTRRLSLLLAIGTGYGTREEASIESPVLTAGLGFDITKGVSVAVGYSAFNYKASSTASRNMQGALTYGITLNTDLWRTIVGGN